MTFGPMRLLNSAVRRAVYPALVFAFFFGVQPIAFAAPPVGCDAATPGSPYASNLPNSYLTTSTAAGSAIAAAEASTSQVMELVAQRRSLAAEEVRACPA